MSSLRCCPTSSSFSHLSSPSPSRKSSISPRIGIPLITTLGSGYAKPHLIPGIRTRKGHHFNAIKSSDQERESQFQAQNVELSSNGGPRNSTSSPSTSLLSFLCPLLKLFSGGDPSRDRNYLFEEATSSLSTLTRIAWGSRAQPGSLNSGDSNAVDPPMRLQLFPFLIDPNTGTSTYESGDIVKYLFQTYGGGRSPSSGLLESTLFTGWMPTLLRAGRGMTLWEKSRDEPPPKKLELFSYENNPYARIVREALCELELPYILHNVGNGSRRANLLLEKSGKSEVPYLIDPNTNKRIGDYKEIISYLFQTYSLEAS
nr:putative thioredoxin-like protein [Ipomoea batatas]